MTVADLDPILDRLRLIKSPREIALVREATRLSGVAIAEAIRSAGAGSAKTISKRSPTTSSSRAARRASPTSRWPRREERALPALSRRRAELKSGDLVLFDYAPDYRYYASDVTRMFPVSGHFSPEQKERYTVYLRMYQALMESIKPNVAPRDIIRDAVMKMDRIVAGFGFSSDVNKQAAQAFVDRYRTNTRNSLGHIVGMEVHDVQPPPTCCCRG